MGEARDSPAGLKPATSGQKGFALIGCDIISLVKIIQGKITIEELKKMAQSKFGNLVKAVVDIERGVVAIDADLHADEEALLLENGSKQQDLWGINIYPELKKDEWIEFDSMINLKPAQGNRARGINSPEIREKIVQIINIMVKP